MKDDNLPAPLRYQGVTVSSTFTDLEEHRAALIKAIERQGLKEVAMENDTAEKEAEKAAKTSEEE